MGNVYSGVVRASLYPVFTWGARWESLSGVCVTAVESRPAGVLGASQSPVHRPFGARVEADEDLNPLRVSNAFKLDELQ